MLSLDTAYRSFGGEVEASSTPTICRLPDSCRHQLSAIAQSKPCVSGLGIADDIETRRHAFFSQAELREDLEHFCHTNVCGEGEDLSITLTKTPATRPGGRFFFLLVARYALAVHGTDTFSP